MLTNAERETCINMMGDDHTTWEVFSDDPYWIRRLDKITTAVATRGEGFIYRLPANQLSIYKPRKRKTKAQREAAAAVLAQARIDSES